MECVSLTKVAVNYLHSYPELFHLYCDYLFIYIYIYMGGRSENIKKYKKNKCNQKEKVCRSW